MHNQKAGTNPTQKKPIRKKNGVELTAKRVVKTGTHLPVMLQVGVFGLFSPLGW